MTRVTAPQTPPAPPTTDRLLDGTSLADKAYRILRQEILRRVHPPGQRLDIQALASDMGISTAPLRDAVRRLETEGLVKIHTRYGTFVTDVTPEDVREVFEVRRALEMAAAQKAALALSTQELADLTGMVDAMRRELGKGRRVDYDTYLGIDYEYHRRIVVAAGNTRLLRIYEGLQAHAQVVRAKYGGGANRAWDGLEEHTAILAALRARDPEGAIRAVAAHLDAAQDSLIAHFTAQDALAAEAEEEIDVSTGFTLETSAIELSGAGGGNRRVDVSAVGRSAARLHPQHGRQPRRAWRVSHPGQVGHRLQRVARA